MFLKLSKSLRPLSVFVFGLAVIFGFNTSVFGVFNATSGRYEDTLTSPHQEAVYSYFYENTSPAAAPGYFLMQLEAGSAVIPADQIQINSITDTYPIDNVTKQPLAGATTREYVVSQATFVANDIINIKVAPQNVCTPVANQGCAQADIPAAVPGRLTIKASLKTSAIVGNQNISTINAYIEFPNGFDINPINWRILTNYLKTDLILDPSLTPTATIRGQGGTGSPTVGQPYTVVVSDIKAVTGNPLQAPAGSCTTTVGGTNYTGTGILNGNCIINITVNAGATIAAGTANISDGGSPISITKNNIPYAGVNSDSFLVSTDIPGLTVSCNGANVNTTTTCSFTLPANKLLPPNFKLGINDATPAGTCTATGSTVNCTGVPTGTTVGTQPIFGQIGTNAKVNTNETVLISASLLTAADIPGITFTCDSAKIVSGGSTKCGFILPSNKDLPSNFTMAVGSGTPAGTCTKSNFKVNCTNVPIPTSDTNNYTIFARIGTGTKTDTGEETFIFEEFYKGEIVYSPTSGSAAPFFRSSDAVNVKVVDFNATDNVNGVGFTCGFYIRSYGSTGNWSTLATNIPYNSTTGCNTNINKSVRGNGLNWEIQARLSGPNSRQFVIDSEYIFRFQGAGTASGQ